MTKIHFSCELFGRVFPYHAMKKGVDLGLISCTLRPNIHVILQMRTFVQVELWLRDAFALKSAERFSTHLDG